MDGMAFFAIIMKIVSEKALMCRDIVMKCIMSEACY